MSGQGVSAQGAQAAATWSDTDFARDWASGDSSYRDLLDLPREASGVVGEVHLGYHVEPACARR